MELSLARRGLLPLTDDELVSKLANSVLVMSHLGRPKPGDKSRDFSLAPVAEKVGELLKGCTTPAKPR